MRKILVCIVCLLAITFGPAVAQPRAPVPRGVSVQVAMKDDYYSPKVVDGVVDIMGVHFANQGTVFHNVYLDPGPRWFTTNLDEGESADTQLKYAGTFPFRCTYHDGMTGTLRVKPRAPMHSGTVGDTFVVQVASVDPALDGYTFDTQRRRDLKKWRDGPQATGPTFDVAPTKPGRYDIRVRLVEGDTRGKWSPPVRIRVR